jgi:5-methyltetrahydrofolate corrinoid/iron sulfur protein methyltransferase
MQIIADNLHVMHPAVQAALNEKNPGPIRELVESSVAAEAEGIDINPGPLSREPEALMSFLVQAVEEVTDLPLLFDTTNPRAIRAGLEAAGNPAIINGLSLEPAKMESILPLAAEFDVPVIGYLLDAASRVPDSEAACYDIALSLLQAAESAGLANRRLIIDPIVAPLMWESGIRHNREVLSVIRSLPDVLGYPVKTIAGLSNLTTGHAPLWKKRLMEAAFLPMLAEAGLDMVLLNAARTGTVRLAKACRMLSRSDLFSWAAVPE